jgi:hypothetical protein
MFSARNCAILGAEKIPRPGMPLFMLEKIISGIPARRGIPAGEGVRFEDIDRL